MFPAVAGGKDTWNCRLHYWGWTPNLLLLQGWPFLRRDGAVHRLPPGTSVGPSAWSSLWRLLHPFLLAFGKLQLVFTEAGHFLLGRRQRPGIGAVGVPVTDLVAHFSYGCQAGVGGERRSEPYKRRRRGRRRIVFSGVLGRLGVLSWGIVSQPLASVMGGVCSTCRSSRRSSVESDSSKADLSVTNLTPFPTVSMTNVPAILKSSLSTMYKDYPLKRH